MKKKVFWDMVLNVASAAIPIIALQLIILPLLATKMSSDNYGLLVTILALMNVVPATFGNVLNNIRLLYEEQYISHDTSGDFSVLLLILEAVSTAVVVIGSFYYYKNFCFVDIVLLVIIAVLWLAREYYIVAFRLLINYKAILINNIILCIGYIVGYGFSLLLGYWQIIYITAYTVGLFYIFKKSNIWKDPFRVTPLFSNTLIQTLLLILATLLPRLLTYADKLLIYPMLGGAIVSVYYAATVFGKVISLVVTPVASVMLTYLSKSKTKDDQLFFKTLLVGGIVCVIGYTSCLVLSRPVLSVIYPQFVHDAMVYIPLTSATAVISAYISLVNPFLLKYFSMYWQIIINVATIIVYLFFGLLLLKIWGLYGFCVGTVIANVFKLVLSLVIYKQSKTLHLE